MNTYKICLVSLISLVSLGALHASPYDQASINDPQGLSITFQSNQHTEELAYCVTANDNRTPLNTVALGSNGKSNLQVFAHYNQICKNYAFTLTDTQHRTCQFNWNNGQLIPVGSLCAEIQSQTNQSANYTYTIK